MGCFLPCFGSSKHRKSPKTPNVTHSGVDQSYEAIKAPPQPTESAKQEDTETPITESREKFEEKLKCSEKKKVTFDLNVKTYEDESTEAVSNNLVADSVEKKSEDITYNVVSHPPNYRYQNCTDNNDEYEDIEVEERELDEDEKMVQEESSESLFSLSIESRKQVCADETEEKEVNSPMPIKDSNARDRSQYVYSVLNPVENLTQWKKMAKEKPTSPLQHQDKENINLEQHFDISFSPEPSFKQSIRKSRLNFDNQEISVDTSLSSWLVESKSKSSNVSVGNSPRSNEDRPILGALTIEELRQFSASTSPRRPRSRSPDETPIVGTVGRYWSCTGQTLDSDSGSSCKGMTNSASKNREDEKVKWNSTPFEARLESALERGIAEA